jgi:hypothetical protein
MDAAARTSAEHRLAEAAAARGLDDPRPPLRDRLRLLRDRQPEDFDRAVAHYERQVLPGLAAGEPLDAWLEYARFLGLLTADGRLMVVDDAGAATPFRPPLAPGALVLFLPDDPAADPFIAAAPLRPSPAQRATIDLLVHRRLAL